MACNRVAILGWAGSVHVARWVRALAERGLTIRLISLDGHAIDGIETIILPRRGRFSYLQHAPRVARLIREFKPDLVHAHYAVGHGLWGMWSKAHPFLVSVWGSDINEGETNLPKRWLVRRILRTADHITATSEYLAERTTKLEPSISQRLTTIPFGITVPDSTPALPDLPLRLAFPKHHDARYAPDLVLEALSLVREKGYDVRITLAGKGPLTRQLKLQCTSLGLDDAVEFTGWIPNERTPDILANHHAIIMPSRRESFGVAVLEAAACGRPAIASNIGGIPEVVQDGATGLLVPVNNPQALAEAIIKLATDRQLLQFLGSNAHAFVKQHYTWDRSMDMMIDLYNRLVHAAR